MSDEIKNILTGAIQTMDSVLKTRRNNFPVSFAYLNVASNSLHDFDYEIENNPHHLSFEFVSGITDTLLRLKGECEREDSLHDMTIEQYKEFTKARTRLWYFVSSYMIVRLKRANK